FLLFSLVELHILLSQFSHGLCDLGKAFNESSVISGEIYIEAYAIYHMSEKLYLWNAEFTLREFCVQLLFLEMPFVLFLVL
ncbi:hypothetical protein Tco_1489483, partial [Tanacetum coccineum]